MEEIKLFKKTDYDRVMAYATEENLDERKRWNDYYHEFYLEEDSYVSDENGNDILIEPFGPSLEGADFAGLSLEKIDLSRALMKNANMKGAILRGANLEGALLMGANLEGANLWEANLEGANLWEANLEGAILRGANLKKTNLMNANLKDVDLARANLEGANMSMTYISEADLTRANLMKVNLEKAQLCGANMALTNLEGADMSNTYLKGASFHAAWMDEKTNLLGCTYDTETDFTATSLTYTHIEPDTLTALQKNIRRKYWMKWYEQHKIFQYPCRLFWWLSDYGTSGTRCIGVFTLLILTACVIYFFITGAVITDLPQLFADTILATFGFGSLFDQLTGPLRLLLAAHVLAGYFLLAVLITRFAVMFQSLTP